MRAAHSNLVGVRTPSVSFLIRAREMSAVHGDLVSVFAPCSLALRPDFRASSTKLQKLAPAPTRESAGSERASGETAATVASDGGNGEGSSEMEEGSGREREGASGGGRGLLGEALAVELDSANHLLSQLVPLLQHSSNR